MISPEKAQDERVDPGSEIVVREIDAEDLDIIRRLNRAIFDEERVINTFDHEDLLLLVAYVGDEEVGFKVGYRENRFIFYSAKGGVLAPYRRRGIARRLLHAMQDRARDWGYRRLAFDTFPNKHVGMTIMALVEGFRVTNSDFNTVYRDYRIRFEKQL